MVTAGALLLVMVAWSRDVGGRRLGAAGLVLLALGIAAGRLSPAAPPPGFLAVNAALSLLGVGLCLLAGRDDWPPRGAGWIPPVAGLVGTVLAAVELAPLVRAGGVGPVAAVTGVMGAAAWGWGWVGRRVVPPAAPPGKSPRTGDSPAGTLFGLVGLVAGALALGLGGHIAVLLGGAAVAGWAGWVALPPRARPRPYAPVILLALLGGSLWFLATVAGPEGLALAAIPSLPLSPAAERLVGLLLAASAWILSGVWPWRQPAGGALTAPVAVWLLLRLGIPAVPAGLAHWRAALFPLMVVGIWQAAIARRPSALAAGAAVLGAASLTPAGLAGAGWLLAAAAALELAPRFAAGGTWPARAARMAIGMAAGWGTLEVLTGGLRAEVTYTVLAVSGAAAALSWRIRRPAPDAVALTPPPTGSIFGPETR